MKSIDGSAIRRNHKQEELAAQGVLFDDLQDYRSQRNAGVNPAFVQIAHALIICGLPYRQTEARQHIRRSRKAHGTTITVTFHALGTDVAMPYGTDRTLLHWLIDQAIKRKDPFVPWSTASQFMEDMGYTKGGKNYQRFATALNAFLRLLLWSNSKTLRSKTSPSCQSSREHGFHAA